MPTIPPEQFPFCGPSYLAASPVIDAQRSINLYPEPGYKSSKTAMGLIGRPGLFHFGTLANSPARSLWAGDNRLFAVGGTHFYEMTNAGTVMTDFGAMGLSLGTGPCQTISNANQLLVCDPFSTLIYYANPAGPAMDTIMVGTALEYLDGFHVAIASGPTLAGTNPNQINASNFLDAALPWNGTDAGTSWQASRFVLRTGAADLTTQLAVLNGQLWIFGQKTIEPWYNAGTPGFPFARMQGATINLGLLAPQTVAKFYNTVMWLGADDRGYAQVYMVQGLNPVRVSSFAIEQYLATFPFQYLSQSTAFSYQENGHTFYILNLTNAGNFPVASLVYDLTTGLWHERAYGGAWPCCFASLAGFGTVPNFVGDGYSGKILYQNASYASDDGQAITYTRTAPHISGANKWIKYSRFELDGDFGTAAPTLDYSDNGGRTFGGRTIALRQAADQGRGTVSPTFRRFFAMQLGRSRDRVFKVSITDSTNLIRIANAYVDAAA